MSEPAQEESRLYVQIPEKMIPFATRPKAIKLAVGGRGGAKSYSVADLFLRCCDAGERLCAAREYQNSIDDSVHALLRARIAALQGDDPSRRTLHAEDKKITSLIGGEIFYRGLARNVDSIRSLAMVDKLWLEEGQSMSEESLDTLLPTIREAGSEIWITMNRKSSKDPVAQRLLKPYERELKMNGGYYEDDDILIVEINWRDNPWFPDKLMREMRRDKRVMTAAKFNHIWGGEYSDEVPDAIITAEMFDACIDAHKRLGITPTGAEVVAFDPADSGDAKAIAHSHGILIKDVLYRDDLDINTAGDWAIGYAIEHRVDEFVWDGVGMGATLRRDFDRATLGKRIGLTMFVSSESPEDPDKLYEPMDGELGAKARSNKDTFANKRAQFYWRLRDRIFRTYLAVTKKMYFDPDTLISFSSEIKALDILRSEICSVPKEPNAVGKFRLMTKEKTRKLFKTGSPNGADAVMMCGAAGTGRRRGNRNFVTIEHQPYDSGVGY